MTQPSFQEWLNRGSPKANKRKRLAPMSKKRKEDSKKYSALRAKFLRANPLCMAWTKILANNVKIGEDRPLAHPTSVEIHHRAKRGQNYLNTDTWLAVSRWSHNWIENNKSEARKIGLLV